MPSQLSALIAIAALGIAPLTAADSFIERRLHDAVTVMQEPPTPGVKDGPLERGTRMLLADGALEAQVPGYAALFAAQFELLGRPTGVTELGVRRFGARAEVAYFIIPCARGVAFVRVVALKAGDNNRVVSELVVSPHPSEVLPPDLITPEIQLPPR
jgi:hypothetical protein